LIGNGSTASIRQEWDLAVGRGHSQANEIGSAGGGGLRRPSDLMMLPDAASNLCFTGQFSAASPDVAGS